MAETLPIEIAPIAAAASKLSVTFFIVKSPFFWRNPITGCYARTMGGRSVFAISEAAQSLSALMWINQARFGFECGVSNRNCRSVGIACDSHLGVKLLRKRLHKTGAQPAFFHLRSDQAFPP